MPIPYPLRDAQGRLLGLAKVETWTKKAAARKGARKSPWRFGALRYSPRPNAALCGHRKGEKT